jgi:hypothetical protein
LAMPRVLLVERPATEQHMKGRHPQYLVGS